MIKAIVFMALGVYIVLNWSSIRNYGDHLFNREEQKSQQTEIKGESSNPEMKNLDQNPSPTPATLKNSQPDNAGNRADKLF